MKKLLIIDDDDVFREQLVRALKSRGFEALSAAGLDAGLELAKRERPDGVVLDLRMPTGYGLEVIRNLHTIVGRIVVLTGFGSIATALEAIRLGAKDYLTKPVDTDQITIALEKDTRPWLDDPQPPTTVPSLERVEWEHIQRVLAECGGNVSQAARILGIHRRSLQRKLGKYPPKQ